MAAGDLETQAAAAHGRLNQRALVRRRIGGQQLLGTCQCILGTGSVDIFRRLGRIGQNRDLVGPHFDHATA